MIPDSRETVKVPSPESAPTGGVATPSSPSPDPSGAPPPAIATPPIEGRDLQRALQAAAAAAGRLEVRSARVQQPAGAVDTGAGR